MPNSFGQSSREPRLPPIRSIAQAQAAPINPPSMHSSTRRNSMRQVMDAVAEEGPRISPNVVSHPVEIPRVKRHQVSPVVNPELQPVEEIRLPAAEDRRTQHRRSAPVITPMMPMTPMPPISHRSPSPNLMAKAGLENLAGRMTPVRVSGSVERGSLGRNSVGRGSVGRKNSMSTGSSSNVAMLFGLGGTIRAVEPRTSVANLTNDLNPRHIMWLKWSQYRHQKMRFLSKMFPVLDPRSSLKLTWDSLVMVVVLYSAIMVPIEVSFPDVEFSFGWQILSIVTDVLFCLDVIHNFFVGFYLNDDDVLTTDRAVIARRYLSSWFVPDVVAVLPTQYMFTTVNGIHGKENTVASLKLTRMVRLVRVTKLTRLIKLRQFAMKIEDVLELDAVIARLTQVISQVFLTTHLLACFWSLIGFSEDPTDATWITASDLFGASAPIRYLYSFYWTISTLAGVGYGDIHAVNTQERIYSMVTQVIGASGYGIIIGNITKILENWNRESNTRVRKMSMVRDFVKKRTIPRGLKINILRYFKHYIAKTSAFDEREILCELSLSLRDEILSETYRNSFFLIPALQRLSAQFVMDMAMYIKPLIAVKGDVLARERSVGTEMFILNHGIVEVKRTANDGAWMIVLEIMTEHGIFGESSLLNYTLHQNSYTAKADCDLYTLPKEDFDRLLEEFPEVETTLLQYHEERSGLYNRVYEQTLARYQVFMNSRASDPVSELAGIENVYPTLTVLLDGVLQSYRAVPLSILEKMTLEISMGVSVFNSTHEKKKMIDLLGRQDRAASWTRLKKRLFSPIMPEHPYKIRWEVFVSILLVYCAIAIPYETTFLTDVAEKNAVIHAIEIAIECVFAIDIVINFRTAYVDKNGHCVKDERAIAVMYLKSWFWIDVSSTIPIATIIDSVVLAQGNSGSKTIYMIRVIRLLKLSRLLKLLRTVIGVQSLGAARHSTTRLIRLTLKVCFIAHMLACGYYYTSLTSRVAYGRSALDSLPTSMSHLEYYVFCLYWAVTTMTTVGYGDTSPGNPAEVAFVTMGMLVGASTFTYVIGTLASVVDEMQQTTETNRERMDRLKAYLKERNISKQLGSRLRRYYEYFLSQRDDENEDEILTALSDNLRSQVVLHLNRDVVSKIAFFATQDDMCVSYLMSILDPEFCTPGEYVFKEGQIGRHMYFLVKGVAEILFHAETAREVVVATLLEGSYFGEIAMLTMSKRAASIRAKTYMNMLVLSRTGLDRISQHYPEMANNILSEFRKKITHIKQTSLRHLGSLIQEDVRAARQRTPGLEGSHTELTATLHELEDIVSRVVRIYGGGEKGKRKALACVVHHLRKYEFSLDDFLHAAEEFTAFSDHRANSRDRNSLPTITISAMMMNKLQHRMKRRSSFG